MTSASTATDRCGNSKAFQLVPFVTWWSFVVEDAGATVAAGTGYALASKCPMCLAAYRSAFGVTLGMASLTLSALGAIAVASVVWALFSLFGLLRNRHCMRCPSTRLANHSVVSLR